MKNKKIFITGGTGSFGSAFVPMTLKKFKPKNITIYSRDESKQWEMKNKFSNYKNIKFIIGDVRDFDNLKRSMKDFDYVVHAAATKIVPTSETNPFECIKTNIIGSMNVINACLENKITNVIALSTDKACNPINLYGATKLAADKLFISANNFELQNKYQTKFSVVRYGNVIGSRGSVIPFFKQKSLKEKIPITDLRMTRFLISLKECVEFVWQSFGLMRGGEIFVKKIPSIKILDIANAISIKKNHYKIIGIRAGEKLHEQMISSDDSIFTYEYIDHYRILHPIINNSNFYRSKLGKKVNNNFSYASDKNSKWITAAELKKWLKKYPTYF
jgi:UDP-N-acetylglucosamine 4,6-dehydratase (inverting)